MIGPSTASETIQGVADAAEVKGRSLWADARRRLLAHRAAVVAMAVLAVLVLLAVFGQALTPHGYNDQNYAYTLGPPDLGQQYYFGTDANGRDLFARSIYGLSISLMLGVAATLVSLVIGVGWGATAGYLGGRVDNVMMRVVDILYSLPFMFFVIILMVVFGRNIFLIFVALGAVEWLTMARIVRGQTLAIREKEFIEAAVAAGLTSRQVITRHIVPNLLGPVVVYITLTIPQVILVESFLSFLGLGVSEPQTSLGVLIKEGADQMEVAPWMLIFPATFLATALFCFNFIGDGLRDALDPKDR